MSIISLNSLSSNVFKVNAEDTADRSEQRADLVAAGRLLTYEYARKGQAAIHAALKKENCDAPTMLQNSHEYAAINEKFQADHLLYAAKIASNATGSKAPATFEEFKRNSVNFYKNELFFKVLASLYQEILTPILPAVYSEAVSAFAEVVEVGFGETYAVSIGSNDIPVFQDSAWGASRSVPRNRFYSKDYTLNPQPKSAWVTAKWTQLVANRMDFGRFFANITAGMYAKTMGMWNQAMMAAAQNTNLIPASLSQTFSNANWISLANKLSAVNNTSISNIFATGSAVALSKVLPTEVTGSTNVNMDAAIATLLGADYTRTGYLGEFMSVRLMPLRDVVIPGTQNSTVQTMLDPNTIWMMAGSGYKPMVIAYNRDTPITFDMRPEESGDMEIGINTTIALDSAAVFASRVGIITVA